MRTFICSLLLVAACLACGCSSKKQVNGKIVKGGQPFTVGEKGVFVLSFVPEGGTDKTVYNANTKPDGTFTIVGPENKGIPSGKYKVHLTAMDPYPTTDKLAGKYAPGKSTLVVDVGSGELVIDVDK
jgi:hypothetical protein